MWSRITNYISFLLNMSKKHGVFGRKGQIQFLARYINAERNGKDADQTEVKQLYREICEQSSEIRAHFITQSNRIGEYISRYLIAAEDSKKNAEKGILDVFFLGDYINHNSRLTTIMGRNIKIIDKGNINTWEYVLMHFPKVEFLKYYSDYEVRNFERLLDPKNTAQYLLFTPEEAEEAKKKKELMGLHGSFVCVSSRDATYLETIMPGADASHHDYRDSDVNNLDLSSAYLETKGIAMVRMGRYVKDKVEFGNCIDYANKFYDELMDIALMKECKFYVGDTNGLGMLPRALDRPCAFKNWAPIFWPDHCGVPQNPKNLVIFKKYYSKTRKRFLSLREVMEVDRIATLDRPGIKYAELGIEMIENSAEEILDLVMEMNARMDGEWVETKEDIELQNKYRSIFNQWVEQRHYKEWEVLQANIGALFLRKNSFLLD